MEAKYGIPKDSGGDNAENIAKMEHCIEKVMLSGKSKESAIRICKVSLFGENKMDDPIETMRISENLARIALSAETLNDIEPKAIGKVLSKANRKTLKDAVAMMLDLLDRTEDGDDEVDASRADLVIGSEGLSLEAGERFGAMLKRARTAKGLMLSDVCKALKGASVIDEQCLMRYESGYTREMPPEDIVNALAGVLHLDAPSLMRAAELDYSAPVSTY